ncbi:MAG: hypothetical protein FWF29_02420 [Treponema sp.]|nr:hypothetical protein [Treponema sp.]
MTQDEIDRLILTGPIDVPVDIPLADIQSKNKSHTMLSMLKRLEFARENLSFEDERDARITLHAAAFDLWLSKHNMTRNDYYQFVNRELRKRNYPYRFKI